MKHSFIQTCLSLLLLAGMPPAFAGNITLTSSNQANNLPLGGEGGTQNTQIIKVGTISLSTTSANGFTLNIIGSNLTKSEGVTPIVFQVTTVPSGSGTPGAGAFTTEATENYSYVNNNPNASETRDLYIKYTPASLQDPGNYSASLNLTIADN
ncbi:hypothetical protein [Floridanema aerugineum]|jgi:hypothetical protein|uniref:Uncharacterized protein n=1 Tax=Floridaenema aerugineum BLCC-F46 TaxID=3153654 RepID=A0ABV4XIA3_9CYAN